MIRPSHSHPDRPVSVGGRDGRAVVLKRPRHDDSIRAFAEHGALWESPFGGRRCPPGIPRPISVDDGWIVMEAIEGPLLAHVTDTDRFIACLDPLAALLADLHGSGVSVARRRGPRRLVRSILRKVDDVHPATREDFAAVVDLLACGTPNVERLVPSHGDFSPRNVISSPDGLRLIDLDRLQMAAPERDLAAMEAWLLAARTAARSSPTASALAGRFIRSYSRCSGHPIDIESYRFHRAASLLRIVASSSSLRADATASDQLVRWAARDAAPTGWS